MAQATMTQPAGEPDTPALFMAVLTVSLAIFVALPDAQWTLPGRHITTSPQACLGYALALPLGLVATSAGGRALLARRLDHPSVRWFGLYFLWCSVAWLANLNSRAFLTAQDYLYLLPVLLAFVAALAIEPSERTWRWLAGAWGAGALVQGGLALLQWYAGWPYFGEVSHAELDKFDLFGERSGTSVVVGFLLHPNALAECLLPLFVGVGTFVAGAPRAALSGRLRAALALFAAGAVGLLILSSAKGALVSAAVGLGVGVGLLAVKPARKGWVLAALWLVIVGGIIGVSLYVLEVFDVASLATILSRVDLYTTAGMLIADHPALALIGGAGNWWDYYVAMYSSYDHNNTHTVFANQVLMYGVVGLSFLLLGIGTAVGAALRAMGQGGARAAVLAGCVATLFAVALSYAFEGAFILVSHKAVVFACVAVMIGLTREAGASDAKSLVARAPHLARARPRPLTSVRRQAP